MIHCYEKNLFLNILDESLMKQFCKATLSNRNKNIMQTTYTILNILVAICLKIEIIFNILKSNTVKILPL